MNSSINNKIFSHITLSPHFFSKNKISFMSRVCDEFYLGFIIPRSMGPATERNLFKRRCRASLSEFNNSRLLPLRGLVIKPRHINFSFNQINDSILNWVSLKYSVEAS